MKRLVIMVLLGIGAAWAQDPTRPTAKMAESLKARAVDARHVNLAALVVGGEGEGVALLGDEKRGFSSVRKDAQIVQEVDGVPVTLRVRSITVKGVEMETGKELESVFIPGSFQPLSAPTNLPTHFLRYLEATRVPLDPLLRLVSDQTGVNISISERTVNKVVSLLLRNVTAATAVEEICRTTGLWFRQESGSDVFRVTTMEEYEENLNTFREETTETFTLLYPNVVEVASVIYGLYPDRTLLSLGEDEFIEDEENDLSERFRRFRVLEQNGNSQFMNMQAPQATSSGSRSGSGEFSFSTGNAASRLSQWDQLYDRARRGLKRAALSASEAKAAAAAGGTNVYERANVFVSMSRKNNVLIVRTSDVKVMDEVRRLVKQLDVPTPMVLMEVKVLELDITDDYDAGVRWSLRDFNSKQTEGLATHLLGHDGGDVRNLVAQSLAGGRAAFDPTFSFAVVSDYVKAEIEMLQKDGKVRVLSTPTLLTANNEVSRIFSGKEYPLVTGWTRAESTSTQGVVVTTPATAQIERKDVGTMLLITPNINADKTVTLRLLQENSSVAADKVTIPVEGGTGESKEIEYVESRSLTGTFIAKDDMLVMAGGLIRESDEDKYWRTPVLGSIPLLGWLFRGTEKAKRRTELVVLIKPHVIMTPMEGGRVSEELMKALSAHPAADGRATIGIREPAKREHSVMDDVKNIVK